ncbi:cache domain-containing protein [Aquincola sp. MAHUQ-54]|uniref:Cache domain-containing protein n=1 Tax=Aquincola agrisoli TaxID=3119538 RepID=A0AAW9QF58_9BURK
MGANDRFDAPRGEDPDATVIVPARGLPHPAADDDATVVQSTVGRPPPHPRPAHSVALPPRFRLLEYRIDRVLGQGGFGITYLATDVHLNAKVAIKEYLPESIAFRTSDASVSAQSSRHRDRYRSGLENFLVEARTLASFRHPNIVRVARFFEAHRTAYMVLEYERGQPLKTWWPAHPRTTEAELVRLLQPLLDGIAVMHAAGFLHRDIKPDNIQVRAEDGSLVLLDFGSAQQAADAVQPADIVVTPGFAPIEQYGEGTQGPWTDIHALGATLYWMVAGRKPPDADARIGGADPMPPASEVGAGRFGAPFLAAIDWALRPEAAQRPQDIAEWQRALFTGHAGSLGLHEALQAGDAEAQGGRTRRRRTRLRDALRTLFVPAAWPLAAKMTLAMVLTALLPMGITGYYNLRGSLAAVAQAELQNLEQLAHSTAGRLAQLIGDSRKLARVLGTDSDFALYLQQPDGAALPALRDKLQAVVRANPDIHLIMVMDTAGVARVSSDPEVMGRNFAFRDYFKAAIGGREHVTGIVVGAVAGQAGMFYAQPVAGADGHIIGCVVLRLRAASFSSILDDVPGGTGRTPFLIDGDGVLIHHPREDLLYRSLAPLPPARAEAIRADQRFRRDSIRSLDMPDLAAAMVGARQQGYIDYRSTVSGASEIAGFAPVAGHDWVVGVTESRTRFEAPLAQLYTHLLWSGLLVGLLFTGLALRFARSIVRPLQALTRAADALKQGELDRVQITATGRDEIGQLQRTFQVMVDVLRQREREHRRSRPAGERG